MPRDTSHLKPPWKPGQSGNPGGRPKRRPISDSYQALADVAIPAKIARKLRLPKGSTWRDTIAYAILQQAANGNVRAAAEVREAIEGKATQRIELSGEGAEAFAQADNRVDISKLSRDELIAYRGILRKAGRSQSG